MRLMSVEEYKRRMLKVGWSVYRVDRLVEVYQSFGKKDDGKILVLEGDFKKENLRKFEYN